jgi:hypothetical protein
MDGKEYISNRRFAIIDTYKYYLTEVGREILGYYTNDVIEKIVKNLD